MPDIKQCQCKNPKSQIVKDNNHNCYILCDKCDKEIADIKQSKWEGVEVEMGECICADVALVGALLIKNGVVRKEKEEIKKHIYKVIVAHRKDALKTKKIYA